LTRFPVKRAAVVIAVSVYALFGLGVGAVSAGEITGNGKETPIKSQQAEGALAGPANSWCAFSGLNDDPEEDGNRTQSWGTGVSENTPVSEFARSGFIREFGPGTECRGGLPTAG
jgi:hypothetical protein